MTDRQWVLETSPSSGRNVWYLSPYSDVYNDFHAYIVQQDGLFSVENMGNIILKTATLQAAKTAYLLLIGDT